MATYNGSQYLVEQVRSILAQQDVEVVLRVCDDRSTDNTYALLQELADKDPRMIVSQNQDNVGVAQNFMQMVFEPGGAGFDYYAFADQDDIWLPNKLSHAIGMLGGAEGPTLYYSDVTNFDQNREWSDLSPYRKIVEHPTTLLVRGWAAGCTMVFNRELREVLCLHKPDTFFRIHDVWVHLVARCCGQVVEDLDHSFIRRRITGHNVAGELKDHHTSIAQAASDLGNLRNEAEHAPSKVAQQLEEEFGDGIKEPFGEAVHMLAHYRASMRTRILAAMRFDFWQPTLRGRLTVRLCFLLGRY